jgi:hypothetical protein
LNGKKDGLSEFDEPLGRFEESELDDELDDELDGCSSLSICFICLFFSMVQITIKLKYNNSTNLPLFAFQ